MAESRTAVIAALTGNALLGALKGTSAAATGSAAMLAETFHSIADTGNQVLLLLGLRLAHRSPRPHESSVWSYVVLGGAFVFETASLVVALARYGRPRATRRSVSSGGITAIRP